MSMRSQRARLLHALFSSVETAAAARQQYWRFTCSQLPRSLSSITLGTDLSRIRLAGSESEQSGVRSQQVSNELTYYADNELTALRTLTHNGCESAPTLLDYNLDRQDKNGVVPRGFIISLLMNELPGARLTNLFWNLPTTEPRRNPPGF